MKSMTRLAFVGQPGDALPTVSGGLFTLLLVKAVVPRTIATLPTDPVMLVLDPIASTVGRAAPTPELVVPAEMRKYCRGWREKLGRDEITVKVPVPVRSEERR